VKYNDKVGSWSASVFLKNSNNILSEMIVEKYNYLIDDYMVLPTIIISLLTERGAFKHTSGDTILKNGLNIESMFLISGVSKFKNFKEIIKFIKKIRKDRYFFIYKISIVENLYELAYADPSLELKLIGYESLRSQRLRDKKINKILNN